MRAVLFCPFCREAFEDREACPEHGLRLVSLRDLPPRVLEPGPEHWVSLTEPRYGRGLVMVAALLLLAGFMLPLAELAGEVRASSTLLQLARGREKTLWLVPMVGVALLAILARRRTLGELQAARASVLWLALLPALVVGLTLLGAADAATALASRARGGVELSLGAGSYFVFGSVPVAVLGAFRLGRPAKRRPPRVTLIDEEPG